MRAPLKFVSNEDVARRVEEVSAALNDAGVPLDAATLAATGVLFFAHMNRNVPSEAHEQLIKDLREMAKGTVRVEDNMN